MRIIKKIGLIFLNILMALPIIGWCIRFTAILVLCLFEIAGVIYWTCREKLKPFNYSAAWFALCCIVLCFIHADLRIENDKLKNDIKIYKSIIEEKDAKMRMMDAMISFREEIFK